MDDMDSQDERWEVNLRPYMAMVKIANAQFGIVLASLLFFLAIAKDRVRSQFKWYLMNCSISDVFCCIAYILDGILSLLNDKNLDDRRCNVTVYLHLFCMGTSMTTLMPLAINRYISIKYSDMYEKYYSGRNAAIQIALTYILPFLCPLLLYGRMGHTEPNSLLCSNHPTQTNLLLFSIILITFLVLLFAFFSFAHLFNSLLRNLILSRLRNTRENVYKERLVENKQLSQALTFQSTISFCVQFPYLVTFVLYLTNCLLEANNRSIFGNDHFIDSVFFFVQTLHSINPLVNSIVILTVVQFYRIAAVQFYRDVCRKLFVTETQVVPFSDVIID